MFAFTEESVQVITGADEYRGDVYNRVEVIKRDGKWVLENPTVVDLRATEDRAELIRRAKPRG